jgi:hypothetical protein
VLQEINDLHQSLLGFIWWLWPKLWLGLSFSLDLVIG